VPSRELGEKQRTFGIGNEKFFPLIVLNRDPGAAEIMSIFQCKTESQVIVGRHRLKPVALFHADAAAHVRNIFEPLHMKYSSEDSIPAALAAPAAKRQLPIIPIVNVFINHPPPEAVFADK